MNATLSRPTPSPALPHPSHSRACRLLRLAWALLALAGLASACARPPAVAWPPRPGERTVCVAVYGEGLHSLLALPAPGGRHEEWAFGERIWFMDDKHGLSEHARELGHRSGGAFKALFWPSAGVVELTRSGQPYLQRYPEEAVKTWNLTVSEEGLRRMRAYLEASRASGQPLLLDGEQAYYPSLQHYDVFFTCNHFVAQALREAGVPVRLGWCVLPAGFWWQLDDLAQPPVPAAAQLAQGAQVANPGSE